MKNSLHHITLENHLLISGKKLDIILTYQIFGRKLHTAPIVMINHALTGNSTVCGENGWWNSIIGDCKTIDLNNVTVLSFNIPGNGYDGEFYDDYLDFSAKDIAIIFLAGLQYLNIKQLHALIGVSLGGAIGWEMMALQSNLAIHFIPIACHYKTTDWLHSQCLVQEFLLNSSENPIAKARIHGMLCYRTPQSLDQRFQNEKCSEQDILKSHDWLNFHGKKLTERFSLSSYKLMNTLLMKINVEFSLLKNVSAHIHLIAIDTDLFFPAFHIQKCYEELTTCKVTASYYELKSIHGHDAFLMENDQIKTILKTIFDEKQ